MKVPLFILGALICVGYFVTRQQVRLNVQNAIENHSAVIGMSEAEARQSLGEPLSTKKTEKLFGSEAAITFPDGNEVTFRGGRATKIETVTLSGELAALKKSMGRANPAAPNRVSTSTTGPTGFKAQMGGTALDRRPYQKYNGHVYYSNTDDPDGLGTATETSRRNGLYRGR